MSSDIVLTASLRQNLTSLQSTQQLLDRTQFRLSTGKRVNSALDNPQNFFAAQALDNRAGDLSRILDTIGQSISAVEQANNGVAGITTLVEQAEAVATQAEEAAKAASGGIELRGTVDLSGIDDITNLSGIATGDTITFTITDPDDPSNNVNLGGGVVTLNAGDSIDQVVAEINELNDTLRAAGSDDVIKAELDAGGKLKINVLNGGNLDIEFTEVAGAANDGDIIAEALGLGDFTEIVANGGDANNSARITQLAGSSISIFLFDAGTGTTPGTAAELTDTLDAVVNGRNSTILQNAVAADTLQIRVNNDSTLVGAAVSATGTIAAFIDGINDDNDVNNLIRASYNEETGELNIRAIDTSVNTIDLLANDNAGGLTVRDTGLGPDLTVAAGGNGTLSFALGGAASELAQAESDFNKLLVQIDELVADADFRGTNLLTGATLTTFFNEDRTNRLETVGRDLRSVAIGLQEASLTSADAASRLVTAVLDAKQTVRSFGSTLSNDLAIIQTRQNFTESTVNTLTNASSKLTIANQNEEGANLLALQTRQQLGVTSLSLASQAQQSVLRLF